MLSVRGGTAGLAYIEVVHKWSFKEVAVEYRHAFLAALHGFEQARPHLAGAAPHYRFGAPFSKPALAGGRAAGGQDVEAQERRPAHQAHLQDGRGGAQGEARAFARLCCAAFAVCCCHLWRWRLCQYSDVSLGGTWESWGGGRCGGLVVWDGECVWGYQTRTVVLHVRFTCAPHRLTPTLFPPAPTRRSLSHSQRLQSARPSSTCGALRRGWSPTWSTWM
jgi:hypothetical protein